MYGGLLTMKSKRASVGTAAKRLLSTKCDPIGHLMPLGVAPGDGERGGTDVDRRHTGLRQIFCRTHGEDAAASADVGDLERFD